MSLTVPGRVQGNHYEFRGAYSGTSGTGIIKAGEGQCHQVPTKLACASGLRGRDNLQIDILFFF